MLNESDKSGHHYLVPDLREKTFRFSALSIMFAVSLSRVAFIILRYFFVYIHFVDSCYHKCIPDFATCLFCVFLRRFIHYFQLVWIFIAAHRLSLVSRSCSSLWCVGFSCCRAWALGAQASVVTECGLSSCASPALKHWLGSCGTWAQLLHSIWDIPRAGIGPTSPTLAGGLLTTRPPGKPLFCV